MKVVFALLLIIHTVLLCSVQCFFLSYILNCAWYYNTRYMLLLVIHFVRLVLCLPFANVHTLVCVLCTLFYVLRVTYRYKKEMDAYNAKATEEEEEDEDDEEEDEEESD